MIMGPVNTYNFIERSQKLIKQYKELNLPPEEYYDVTLLLNACVGLLFIAHEKHKNKIPNCTLKYPTWGIDTNYIKCCQIFDKKKKNYRPERISLQSVCKHIRNSIAHCRFRLENTSTSKIDQIHFEDYDKNGLTFSMTIPLQNFTTFTTTVSQYILNLQSNQKQGNQKLL